MRSAAICVPGQRLGPLHIIASAGAVVLLQPTSGGFGADLGSVDLIDPAFPDAPYALSVACLTHLCPSWSDDVVGVNLPLQLRTPPALDRVFTIRVATADGSREYVASDVAVVGPPGSGYPIQPPLRHDQALLHGTLTEGPFSAMRAWMPPIRRPDHAPAGDLGGRPYRRSVSNAG